MLNESRHLGQIRLILLDEDLLDLIDAERLWENTGKPVLMQVKDAVFDARHMFRYGEKVILAVGIDEESSKRVLEVVCGDTSCEALRIAGIIARDLDTLHNV